MPLLRAANAILRELRASVGVDLHPYRDFDDPRRPPNHLNLLVEL